MILGTLAILTVTGALWWTRRLIEPTCPECGGRSWTNTPSALACERCGWSTTPRVEEQRSAA